MCLVFPQLKQWTWFVLAYAALAMAAQEIPSSLRQADAAYREGVAALNQGDLKTAQVKFEAVTRLAPDAEQGHAGLGAVLIREGQWAAGTHELERALSLKPGDREAETNLAMVYAQTGAAAKAIPLFAQVEAQANGERRPMPGLILAAYARSLAATGQTEAAISRMKEAVAQDAGNAELHDELGSLYAQAREWDRADEQFSEAIRLKSDFALAHLHLGFVDQGEGKPGATEEWKKAYSLAPHDERIANSVGKALADAGDDRDAVAVLERALALEPASTAARYQLALVYQRVNRLQDAIRLLKSVVEREPKNADALINLGMALSQAHEAKDGLPFLQRATALVPNEVTAHQDLAAAYIQVNQISDAIGELKIAIKLAPKTPQLHYDLGVAYKLEDDASGAIPELETAAKLNPSGYEPPYVLGLLYMQVARYAEAAQQLEVSLKLRPQNGDGWATLGNLYNKLDRLSDAITALHEAIRQLPDRADSHLILASVLTKQNQPAQAAEERKLAADLMRAHMNLQRAEVATNSGKSLLASGKIDDAIAQFREALSFDPKYAQAHEELAQALERQGKSVEAAAERAQAAASANSAQ
jgi:protein O-GlcNAc transferase